MAINARFQADFSSFQQAVEKAEVKLKSFSDGAGRAEQALNRMSNGLSGNKLIQDATLMVTAVDKVGGVATLTDKELQKVARQAQEAADKMARMGIGVPENLRKIIDANASRELEKVAKEAATAAQKLGDLGTAGPGHMGKLTGALKPIQGGISSLIGTMGPLAGAIGIGFSVGAVVNFGKSMLETAGKISDLSDATGIAKNDLQRLAYVGAGAGIDMDTFGRAVGTLSERLAGGDASAAAAVQKLGLNVDTLIRSGPKEAFVEIGEAIGRMQDPMEKNAIAADVFGGKLSKQLIPILGDLRTQLETVPQDAIISDAMIEKADALGDAFDRLKIRTAAWAFNAIELLGLVDTAMGTFGKTQKEEADKAAQAAKDYLQTFTLYGPGFVQGFQQGADAVDKLHDAFRVLSQSRAEESLRRVRDRLREIDPGVVTFKIVGLTEAVKPLTTEPVFMPLLSAVSVLKTDGVKTFNDIGEAFKKIEGELAKIERHGVPAVFTQTNLAQVGIKVDPMEGVRVGRGFGDGIARGVSEVLAGMDDVIVQAFTNGGGWDEAARGMAAQFASNLGKMIGGAIGGVAGPIGKFLGSIVGGFLSGPDTWDIARNSMKTFLESNFKSLDEFKQFAEANGIDWRKVFGGRGLRETQEAIDEISRAVSRMDKLQSGAARFGPSKKELEQLAVDAADTYAYMLKSGQYTADQIAQAFKASQEAQAAALGINTQATTDHLNKLQKGLNDLTARRESLWAQIAGEAPEEVMGVVEAGQRAQLAVLDDQILQQRLKMEEEARLAAEALESELSKIKPNAIGVPYFFYQEGPSPSWNVGWNPPTGAATGGIVGPREVQAFGMGGVVLPFTPRGTDTVPAMLTPGELVLNANQQKAVSALMKQGSGSGASVVDFEAMKAELAGLRRDIKHVLPRLMADAALEGTLNARNRR